MAHTNMDRFRETRSRHLQNMTNKDGAMPEEASMIEKFDLFTELLALMTDEELIRFRRRAALSEEFVGCYRLMETLSNELIRRDLIASR